MTKNILRKYYEMQGKIILPTQKKNNNVELAATVGANFASIGFPMTTDQVKKLAKADKEDIIKFYKINYEMLSDVVGAGKELVPFYTDFPEGCMQRSHAEYFLDQIIYCMSGLQVEPNVYKKEKKKYPFLGTPMHRILIEGSEEDLRATFELAVKSAIAYSKEQREFILEYVNEFPDAINVLIDNTDTKNRENAVACAMMIEKLSGSSIHTASFMKQPADLLRYAAFKSVEKTNEGTSASLQRDAYSAIALRDNTDTMPSFRLSRPHRAFIMNCLADMDKGSGERLSNLMHGHDTEWALLFNTLHITDNAWRKPKYDNVKRAIIIIQSGEKIDRPARRIEEAVKAGDVEKAVKETSRMSGEFMRRFDKLYRMGIEAGKTDIVLDALKNASKSAGIATVTGTIGNIEQRDHDDDVRYFKGKNGKVIETTGKNRKAFTNAQIKDVVDYAMSGLAARFAGKESMGKVYMSDGVCDVRIPVDIRDNSGAIGSMTSGSKMPIADDWNKMRFFVGWTNMGETSNNDYFDSGRIDIDLTVAFFDKNMNVVGFCGWNGEKHNKDAYVYSGDVRDGGPVNGKGRGEFIDVDLNALKSLGIAYMIPQINSYTGQTFAEQPNTCFGVMKRTDNDMGKSFEPSTVVNRFVLDYKCTQASPYIIDVVNREILWMNEQSMNHVASTNLRDTRIRVARTCDSKGMLLSRLIEANVAANGEWTKNAQKADVIFVRDADDMAAVKKEFDLTDEYDTKFVFGNNMEYIVGYLMKDAESACQ